MHRTEPTDTKLQAYTEEKAHPCRPLCIVAVAMEGLLIGVAAFVLLNYTETKALDSLSILGLPKMVAPISLEVSGERASVRKQRSSC